MCIAIVRPHQNVHRNLALNQLVGSVPESLYTLSELKSLYAPSAFAVAWCGASLRALVCMCVDVILFDTGIWARTF